MSTVEMKPKEDVINAINTARGDLRLITHFIQSTPELSPEETLQEVLDLIEEVKSGLDPYSNPEMRITQKMKNLKSAIQKLTDEECTEPGRKERSKGKGRGLGIGKGKGPLGIPVKEKTAQRYYSEDPQDLANYLKGVAIIAGKGFVSYGFEEWEDPKVIVAIIHDGSGYTPGGAIYVDYYDSSRQQEEALQAAFEILEEHEKETNPEYVEELMEEWGDDWNEIMTESYDGKVWVLPLSEAMSIINANQFANRFVEFESV